MKETAPRNLAFFAGKFDAIPLGVTIPTLKDFKEQAPQAICQINVGNVPRTMLINLHKPPFDNPELRRAMVLSLDRKAFIQIINEGVAHAIGANMLPAPNGVWGMPLRCPADAARIRARCGEEPRRGAQDHGETRLRSRQPARHQGIDAQLPGLARSGGGPDLAAARKSTSMPSSISSIPPLWYPKMVRKDFTVGAVPIESGVDDPDQMFYENYYTGAARNYAGYSDPEIDKLIDQQSMTADPKKRKEIVWQIERRLAEAYFRPVLFYPARRGLLSALGQGLHADDQQHL